MLPHAEREEYFLSMNVLHELQTCFRQALGNLVSDETELALLVDMVRRSQDAKFGDYQANFAMPLGKRLGKPPRDVANDIVQRTPLTDLCQPPEIAGPGFINLRLRDDWLADQLNAAVRDERLGIAAAAPPRTVVV